MVEGGGGGGRILQIKNKRKEERPDGGAGPRAPAAGVHFLALAELRGGVTGRPAGFSPLNCPYLPLFLSAGFRIWGAGDE